MSPDYIGKDRADECCAPFGQEELCALLAELRAMRDRIDQMVITVQHVTVDGTGNVQLPFQEEIGDPDFGNAGSFAGAKSVKAVKVIADAAKLTADAAMEANTDALLTLEQSAGPGTVSVIGKNAAGKAKTTVKLPAVDARHAGVMTPAKMDEIAEEMDRHALDNAVVHNTGNEDVNGRKTFKEGMSINRKFPFINFDSPDSIRPSVWKRFGNVSFNGAATDASSKFLGYIDTTNDGTTTILSLTARHYSDAAGSAHNDSKISVVSTDTDSYGTAPPTPTNARGSEIATAGWVRSLLQSAGIQVTSLQMERTYAPVRAEGIRMMNADPEQADAPQIGDSLTLDAAPQVHAPVLSQADPEPPMMFDE